MASRTMAGVKRTYGTMVDAEEQRTCHPYTDPRASKRSFYTEPSRPSSDDLTASRSTSHTPPSRAIQRMPFHPDASIVLVGIRGSGKSTLAIIASTAMKRRIIDLEKSFQEATGLSTVAYKKTHDVMDYQRRQYGVLDIVLRNHQKDCIIVCSWMERGAHTLLENFAASHPVVHVTRDFEAIQEYLKVTDEHRMKELLRYTATAFRAVANLEFFNISERRPTQDTSTNNPKHATDQESAAPYLTLKRAERHFLKFLSLVMPQGTIPFIESAFPLASIPTESRQFTYAVSIPLSRLRVGQWDVADLETGADAIEIVIDDAYEDSGSAPSGSDRLSSDRASEMSRAIGSIRRNVVIPIIYHVPWLSSGQYHGQESSIYLENILHVLRLCPEYMTLDLRMDERALLELIKAKGTTKIIGTVHLEASPLPKPWTDPIWMSYYRRAQRLSCDLVRLTRPATTIEDNFEINLFRSSVEQAGQPQLPLIAFNTGLRGRNSACFNRILTSVIPDSLIEASAEGESASRSFSASLFIPPSISPVQAASALQSSFITDALKLYVFGASVNYSLSPAMHNTAIRALGLHHFYKPYSTSSLSSIKEFIHDPFFAGASVGLPFKVEVISLTHSLSSHAKAIGAVNTLIPLRHLNADGSIPDNVRLFNSRNRAGPVLALYGENTDWIGIRACIRRGLSPANAVRSNTAGLVVGAGGMSRAAVYAMLQLGVKNIAIYNRTPANAEKLVSHFTRLLSRHDIPLLSRSDEEETKFHILRSRDEPWPEAFRYPTIIVSCIPSHSIGDSPAPDFTLPTSWLASPTGGVGVDFSYKDLNSPLLMQLREEAQRGWIALDGLDLLPEQGFAQFELFTGRRAPRRLMRSEVFRSYPRKGQSCPTLQPRLENVVEHEP
ncbi:shikimate dehydrogenase substrate binding domain-containing protein [Xylariaceae sp. FL0016]|nr:shikimate dehydrogenase substrate binding domain-containing protein [Xylariaceae sp. FL0016]